MKTVWDVLFSLGVYRSSNTDEQMSNAAREINEYATSVAQQALNDAASRVTYKRGSMEINTDSIINTPIKTP